ncbi:unnamed protein product [Spodoptera littoralis]|uniref:Uncharacterized protein n=1 Tax=Spodoptera littoralis TaxID=7109 RepID=A0A9P0IBX9_SPOLI|nr:unnamed protein product [Spodoptera littoralis]
MAEREQQETGRDSVEPETSRTPAISESESSVDEEDGALKDLLRVDEQYVPLLTLLEQFSPGEDGIQFNRKLKHFETTVSSVCPDDSRVQQAFATFRAAALLSPETARKLVAVGVSFTRQQRLPLLRGALLNVVMQDTFSKLDLLERSNPLFLINAANLMGDYFAEARLTNGDKLHFLAGPLLQYLRALLAAHDVRAHRSLAAQLMQNGRDLLSLLPQEMDDLSISIRLRLLSPPPVSTTWLLLSADLCINKFLALPNTLQQFYAAHLDLTTEENFSEVCFGTLKTSPEKDKNKPDATEIAEKVSQNLSEISLNDEEETKPNLMPIVNAGDGLSGQETPISVCRDTFELWNVKNNLRKRHDLNTWRQVEAMRNHETKYEQTVLPPAQSCPVPDYRPPNINGKLNQRRIGGKEDGTTAKAAPRRNVTEVPRSAKYWDHDDRCDKHYS